MRVHVRPKQLPAFFKLQVAGQRKNMKSALALQHNVNANCKKEQRPRKLTEINGSLRNLTD
jgi:hypothetical protein